MTILERLKSSGPLRYNLGSSGSTCGPWLPTSAQEQRPCRK